MPLPEHSVVVDRRARGTRIRVTAERGVVVVVPRPSDIRRVPGVLREHAAWVERALERTEAQRAHLAAVADAPLPERVDLPGVGLAFDVEYRPTSASGARASQRGRTIVVSGEIGDGKACRAALRRWLARVASEHLSDLLGAVAHDEALSFRDVTVRAQRTRWGSCTRDGRISLNRSLVFLRPDVVRYVMVHELLHAVRHDHSPEFWRLMRERVPGMDALRRELRGAWAAVPPWASERLSQTALAKVR